MHFVFISGYKCHIINVLLTSLARYVLRNPPNLTVCTKKTSVQYFSVLRPRVWLINKKLKWKSSPFCASVLLITMWGPLMWTLPKFRIFLNINSISYSFRSIANQNGVRYSDSTSYFKKYSSSKCKQTVCLHYGLDFHKMSWHFSGTKISFYYLI
jgi:hypothetical protein